MKIQKYACAEYRVIFALIILTVITAAVHAQVNQDELEQNLPPVIFINFDGPHSRVDTREQIRQIGVDLGLRITAGRGDVVPPINNATGERSSESSYKIESGATNRYFVIHCGSGTKDGKIDADILGLGVDAGVDHIRNLRVIIQGYLQAAYDYSERDASLLAEYITIYNAVYRGSWDYFSNRYTDMVMENISSDKAGLSIRYDEWPGRTLLLIPLGYGGLSSVDTSTISDRRVIEEMRKEEDQGVSQRQDMVDLKEREAGQAEQRASTERETVRQEEREIARERSQTQQERQDIAAERQRTQEDQDAGRVTTEQARQLQEDLDRREQAVEEKEQELNRRDAGVEQRREEAQRLEDFAEQKTDEAQQEREDIARDQQAAIVEDASSEGILGIMIEGQEPTTIGRLVRMTPAGTELSRSPLDTVHVRTVTFLGGRILAIAGENKGNGAVRLIEINLNNLEIARQGDDDIMTGSLLWVNNNDLYAITVDLSSNSCYLSRFNTNLAVQAKSGVKVHPGASVTIQQGYLLTQREDGTALLLNPADLTEAK